MAEHESAPDAIEDLKYFGLFLLALGFIWLAGGGYTRYQAQQAAASPTPASGAVKIQQIIVQIPPQSASTPIPVATPGSDVYIVQ